MLAGRHEQTTRRANNGHVVQQAIRHGGGAVMVYRANIEELPRRDGRFRIWGHGIDLISNDPEYAFCHQLGAVITQDGPIEFCRDGIATHKFASVRRAARCRTAMGDLYPRPILRRVYKGERAAVASLELHGLDGISTER
jgi:hypothetical protein